MRGNKSDPGKRERYGTFDLWHRSARETPATGDISIHSDTGSIIRYGILGVGLDHRLDLLPESGISLLSALQNIPDMTGILSTMGVTTKLVRGEITQVINKNSNTIDMQLIIHPGEAALIDEFVANISAHPNSSEEVNYHKLSSGGVFTVKSNILDINYPEIRTQWPSSACTRHPISHFWPSVQCLNEFGFIYIALFIVGNYTRYYPDFWMRDVEETTDLGAVIEELTNVAERRMGILALSELSFQYHVPTN